MDKHDTNTNTSASLKEVAEFLLGEAPLRGFWFGEKPSGCRAPYWWRKYLRTAMAALAAPVQDVAPTDAQLIEFAAADEFLLFCDEEQFVDIARAVLARWGAAQPAAQPADALQIGILGSAYDPPGTRRAFTYQHQPGNVLASRLGTATEAAASARAGDSIDRGLGLLKALEDAGFGVFQTGDAS